MKDIKQLEKEVIKSLEENVGVNWDVAENNPNLEFEMLIDHVKRLFKKYAGQTQLQHIYQNQKENDS